MRCYSSRFSHLVLKETKNDQRRRLSKRNNCRASWRHSADTATNGCISKVIGRRFYDVGIIFAENDFPSSDSEVRTMRRQARLRTSEQPNASESRRATPLSELSYVVPCASGGDENSVLPSTHCVEAQKSASLSPPAGHADV